MKVDRYDANICCLIASSYFGVKSTGCRRCAPAPFASCPCILRGLLPRPKPIARSTRIVRTRVPFSRRGTAEPSPSRKSAGCTVATNVSRLDWPRIPCSPMVVRRSVGRRLLISGSAVLSLDSAGNERRYKESRSKPCDPRPSCSNDLNLSRPLVEVHCDNSIASMRDSSTMAYPRLDNFGRSMSFLLLFIINRIF